MKTGLLFLLFVLLTGNMNRVLSQVRPSLSINGGISIPSGEMSGELVMISDSGLTFINSDFIKNNYAVSTGVTISGSLKVPIDKKGFIKGVFNGAYSYFNAFTSSVLGSTTENGLIVPVRYDNRFSTTSFGLGVELTPAVRSKIKPFVNSEFTFNILSLSLLKNDMATAVFDDAFRMGINTGAGVSVLLGNEYSLEIGGNYHMSNIFLKSESESYNERVGFGRESIPINDEEGSFYSNLSDPESVPVLVNGIRKNANWWNISLGINILLGISNKTSR